MPTVDPLEVALEDRVLLPRNDSTIVGIEIYNGGVLTDATGPVIVSVLNEASETVLATVAQHPSTGTYDIVIGPPVTSLPGLYQSFWEYNQGGVKSQVGYIEVGPAAPSYLPLSADLKGLVQRVWSRFEDLYDSPLGGPHLQVYAQTKFGLETVASLMAKALGRLNTIAQPHHTYTVLGTNGTEFPVTAWGAVLEQATFVEVLKHLRRSYVEQPNVIGVNVARTDRRDYMDRWGQIVDEEQRDLDEQIEQFKIAHMGLGGGAVLVSGGVYGNWGPVRNIGPIAARPAYWRWY